MTKQAKSALGKIAVILQITMLGLSSAINLVSTFAPEQTHLLDILSYIYKLLAAVISNQPLPEVPNLLLPSDQAEAVKNSFAVDFEIVAPVLSSLESKDDGEVTNAAGQTELRLIDIAPEFFTDDQRNDEPPPRTF